MAGKDGAAPPSPPPALPHPSYPEMIVEAIRALGVDEGSNKGAISDYIKGRYGSSLPAQHNAFLTGHLARMKASGELAFLKKNYLLPNEEEGEEEEEASPLRTGEHKDPAAAAAAATDEDSTAPLTTTDVNPVPTKRGRGRPPKTKDPVAVGSSAVPTTAHPVVPADAAAVPVKRGRGRPPKPKNPVAEDSGPTAASVGTADANAVHVKRGRGRPPKPKDPNTVVTDRAASPPGRGRGRGRPPKMAKVAVEDPSGEPAAAPGVAADANAVPVKRGRGRPPKVRPAVVGKPSES